MAGRGPQSLKKRLKEQQRRERQMEKNQRRAERKDGPKSTEEELHVLNAPLRLPEFLEGDTDLESESDDALVG